MDAIFSKISFRCYKHEWAGKAFCCKEQKHPFSTFKMIMLKDPELETQHTGRAWLLLLSAVV